MQSPLPDFTPRSTGPSNHRERPDESPTRAGVGSIVTISRSDHVPVLLSIPAASAEQVAAVAAALAGRAVLDLRNLGTTEMAGDPTRVEFAETLTFGGGTLALNRSANLSRDTSMEAEQLVLTYDPRIAVFSVHLEVDPNFAFDDERVAKVWSRIEAVAGACGVSIPPRLVGTMDTEGDPIAAIGNAWTLSAVPALRSAKTAAPNEVRNIDELDLETRRAPDSAPFDPAREHLCPFELELNGAERESLARVLLAVEQRPLAEALAGPMTVVLLGLLEGERIDPTDFLALRALPAKTSLMRIRTTFTGPSDGVPDLCDDVSRLRFLSLESSAGPFVLTASLAEDEMADSEGLHLKLEWSPDHLDRPGAERAVARMVGAVCDTIAGDEAASVREQMGPLLFNSPSGPSIDLLEAFTGTLTLNVGTYRRLPETERSS
jgi:hypothetical protein